jgi:shikimate dehydrogenase
MKKYGLIGYPLGHSFSKQYFTEKFIRENITDCAFENFPISSIKEFPALLKDNEDLCGLCVTIPYKEQVLEYVTDVSPAVGEIGATNSLKITGKKITAYNTDYIGFSDSFKALLQPHHQQALVLGTGGAAKAVQYALKKLDIPYLTVSRRPNDAEQIISYQQLNQQLLQQHQLIINCSPAGMEPNNHECPDIPFKYINTSHYLYDLVYKPVETLFLQKGKAAGAITKNGMDMLICQAEATWAIWNSPDL